MEVEFQNTKQDYIEFYKIHLKNRFQKSIVFISIFLFVVVCSVCGDHFTWMKCILTIIGYTVFMASVIYFIPLFLVIIKTNKLLAKEKAYTSKGKLTITDEGLESEGESKSSLRNWESIKSADSNEKFIYIQLIDKRLIVIPKRHFPTDSEAINFLGLLQSRNQKTNWNFHQGMLPVQKPPYKLGFLGFIPLVGAFVGVALVLYGIFKYKDKRLVVIGIAGIAFTVIIYSSLFYLGFKSNFGRGQFAKISQMELNTIVKQVEFYKIQNGVYPDSLQQLQDKDELVNIYDPLLNNRKPGTYNYHRIGNKYTLFSSGIDEIPNTADDIYPAIKIDTNKIGLIIKR